MKVILLTDIPKVGNRYDVKEFKEGYAQNVLIARGLAELATPHAMSKLAAKKAELGKKKEEEQKVFDQLIASINTIIVTIKAKANDKGHLFKAVSVKEVAVAIKEIAGIAVDEHAIIMPTIKELGTYSVTIKKGNKKGECKVIIVGAK